MSKIVLAYSGGLDSAVILHWLATQGHEVTTFTAQLGGHEPNFEQQALKNGATRALVKDLREDWVCKIATSAREMDAEYGKYLLHVALGKIVIAEGMVEVAQAEGATILSHGAHKGENDFFRLENCFCQISEMVGAKFSMYAPWEDEKFKRHLPDREALLRYAQANAVECMSVGNTTLTSEPTMLGVNFENGALTQIENSAQGIPGYTGHSDEDPIEVTLYFEAGRLTKLRVYEDCFEGILEIVHKLDEVGRRMGIGVLDVIEPNINGSKARCIYIQPATTVWHDAHMEIGNLVLNNREIKRRNFISQRAGELIYHGQWFSSEMEDMRYESAERNQQYTGWVRLMLFPGFARIVARGTS